MQTGKRRDEAFWRSVVGEWEQSGEAVGTVAQRHGVTAASIYRWRKQIRPGAFVRITPPLSHEATGLTLDWGGRVRVRVPATWNEDQLAVVFAAAARI